MEFAGKLESVLTRNAEFRHIVEIRNILYEGAETKDDEFVDSLSPDEIAKFQYCPLTTSDVRSLHKGIN